MRCSKWVGDALQRIPHDGALALLAEAPTAVGCTIPRDALDPPSDPRFTLETRFLPPLKVYSRAPAGQNSIALR